MSINLDADKYPEFRAILNERYPHLCFLPEIKGIPDRNYKFDIALKCCKIAIEIEGGIGPNSKGHRGIGNFIGDMEKYNLATVWGWKLFRLTPKETRRKNLTDSKFFAMLDAYFEKYPCTHSAINLGLRILYL